MYCARGPQGLDRLGAPALHPRRAREELEIVDEVHRVIIRRSGPLEVGKVGGGALAIGFRRLLVAADPLHDVRRHVLEVPAAGIIDFNALAEANACSGCRDASIAWM